MFYGETIYRIVSELLLILELNHILHDKVLLRVLLEYSIGIESMIQDNL